MKRLLSNLKEGAKKGVEEGLGKAVGVFTFWVTLGALYSIFSLEN
mgnify:CR=1 FL=1